MTKVTGHSGLLVVRLGWLPTLQHQSDLPQEFTVSGRHITWLCSAGGAAHQQWDLCSVISLVCYQTGSEPWLSYSIGSSGSSSVCSDHTSSCLVYLFARAISLCSLVRSHFLLCRQVVSELVTCHNLAGRGVKLRRILVNLLMARWGLQWYC